MPPTEGTDDSPASAWRGSRVAVLSVATGALLVLVIVVLISRGSEADPSAVETETLAALEGAVAAANAHDLEALMAFYAEDAVVIGHPMNPSRTEGRDAISQLEGPGLELQAAEDANQLFDVVVNGPTVTFGLVFWDEHRVCYSGQGHRVVVEDGLITLWEWSRLSDPCDL